MNFSLSYPSWFILLCLALGLLFAFLLYRKKKNAFPNPLTFYAMAMLRFLSGCLLSFLLLSPILRYMQNKEEKPTIVFLIDNSASQKYAFKKVDSVAYRKNMQALMDDLKQDYLVKEYSLGSELTDTVKFNYNEQNTDIASGLETIMTTLENENLGGIVLASDGIYNKGISPLSLSYPFKGSMYTIGVGDSTVQKDAFVARVFANKIVYLGDQFAIRSDIAAYGCKGNSLTISIFSHNSNRIIASQTVTANDDRFSKSIESILDAKSSGIQHFTISVSKVDGEQNTINNSQDVFVEVLDNKENVLIVGNAPHPDLFAIKEALTKNKNYKVTLTTADKVKSNIADYNLVILHNIPSANFNANSIIDQAKKLGISLWFVVGSQTAIPILNKVQTCVQATPRGGSTDAQGILNKDFSYFTINANNAVNTLPPLSPPFADYNLGPNTQVLMSQKIGSVNTNYPLWMMQQTSTQKIGILLGEGLWRWRMYDFQQYKNYDLVDDYILKTAQYLSVKHDKRQFRTVLSKTVYTESEPITIDAELYNENYELINTPDVNLSVIDANNKKTTVALNKNGNSYSLNLGNFSAGKYSYTASTGFNGKSYSSSGNFEVVAQNIEEVNTTADFGMLNQLAKNYDGEFVFASQIESLKEKIKKNPNIKTVLRSDVTTEPLINWKWIFALLLALLSIEWFVRKRSGNY